MLLLPVLALVFGLAVLVWSSDKFVAGAAALAHNFGVPHLIIGVTIVSLGTSAPEILVSINATLSDSVNLAMGNALGSNIANIGLVLAITAMIAPLPISKRVMKVENFILISVTLLGGWILSDHFLSRTEGFILIGALSLFLIWIFYDGKSDKDSETEFEEDIPTGISNTSALTWFAIGLTLLVISAKFMVWGATEIARAFQVSELIIGATIIALGTSLPELAASITSALKKHHDIALGNIIGSNIFNILAVISIPGLIKPTELLQDVFWRDYLVALLVTVLLSITLVFRGYQNKPIGRLFATIVATIYLGYLYLNYLALA